MHRPAVGPRRAAAGSLMGRFARPRGPAGYLGPVATVDLVITGLANGGDGVGREPDGRVVFVPGGLPGDRLAVRLTQQRSRFARGELVAVTEPGPARVVPPCPEVGRGCGGCGWQHLALEAQREAKRQLVADALSRIGGLACGPGELDVTLGPPLPVTGFRTTVRALVVDGRAAFRQARSHRPVRVATCLVAHPLLVERIEDGRFGRAAEVTLRCGAGTGERLVVADPSSGGVVVPPDVVVVEPTDPGWYHEVVAGRRWRISAGSFFQSRADGAELLVARVAALVPPETVELLDAYCGVGLLSAAVPGAAVVAVEANPVAADDARVNLADRSAEVVSGPFERWPARPVDTVVADPARRGLGAAGVAAAAATGAATVVLVSCDAASLGRDAADLDRHGYRLDHCEVLDLFPHTPHVEVVSLFRRR